MPAGYNYPAPLSGSPQYREPVSYLDLTVVDGATKLAPNFALSEIASPVKGRYGVVQTHAIDRIQDVRDQLGALVINSGYRNIDYNAGVGGATYSRHLYGDAFDIDPVSVSLQQLNTECNAQGAGYVGVYATHIHCDWRDDAVDTVFYGPAARSAWLDPLPVHHAELQGDDGVLSTTSFGWDEGEPLREWSAWSADGVLLELHVGQTYEPPAQAAEVRVRVGMVLTRSIGL